MAEAAPPAKARARRSQRQGTAATEASADPLAPSEPAGAMSSAPLAAPSAGGWRRRVGRALAIGESVVMAGAVAAVVALLAREHGVHQADARVLPGIRLGGVDVGGLDAAGLERVAAQVAAAGLERPLTLVAGEASATLRARALGALPSPEDAIAAALSIGRSGDPWVDLRERAAIERGGGVDLAVGYRFDASRALAELLELAPAALRPSLPTRFDFERRTIVPARAGTALLAFDSLSAVAIGLAAGRDRIELVTQPLPPVADPLAEVAGSLDISTVLGSFSTPYHTDAEHADRTHNVKLGAAAFDGYVLQPGATVSFNEVVGDRSDAAGFRYAPGITAGELVDVVGGGTCQVSSTLYGAAFFAGLDLVEARPHSRPSAYVDMGLDSTVVYGAIDMKLRNPYEFPVVIHTSVNAGSVRFEVLGRERPYSVAFEREVLEVLPFKTIVRDDPGLRSGATAVGQQGKRGFKVKRRRKLMKDDAVVKTEEWELFYPPTTEIVRRGSNPAGALPEGPMPSPLRDPAPQLRIVQ